MIILTEDASDVLNILRPTNSPFIELIPHSTAQCITSSSLLGQRRKGKGSLVTKNFRPDGWKRDPQYCNFARRGWFDRESWRFTQRASVPIFDECTDALFHFQSVVLGSDPAFAMKTLPKSQGRSIALASHLRELRRFVLVVTGSDSWTVN